jgi:hypothetical protein
VSVGSAADESSFARSSWSRDYWLARCEGFRVESPDGRIGIVDHVRFADRIDRPEWLAVRAGLFGRRLVEVPVGEVAEIIPRETRIVLKGGAVAAKPRRVRPPQTRP